MVHNCYFNEILHLQWCSFGISRLSLISRRLFGFYQMSSTITMPIGGWLQTFNDFFCFTFSLKPNLCLQVKLFLLIIVKLRVCNFVIFSLRIQQCVKFVLVKFEIRVISVCGYSNLSCFGSSCDVIKGRWFFKLNNFSEI